MRHLVRESLDPLVKDVVGDSGLMRVIAASDSLMVSNELAQTHVVR